MSTNPGAHRLNLEYYRRAAKSLLKAARLGDRSALERIAHRSNQLSHPPALHHAQLAIAREQGFTSWPQFRTFLIESSLDFENLVAEFVKAALGDLRRAQETLTRHPDIAGADLYTALLLGDVPRVQRALSESPERIAEKGGPRRWQPLLYVCVSRFASGRSSRAADLTAAARLLLSRGADPNASYADERWPDSPLSCLYAATGVNNNPALARALLDAGSPDKRLRISLPLHRASRPRLSPAPARTWRIAYRYKCAETYARL